MRSCPETDKRADRTDLTSEHLETGSSSACLSQIYQMMLECWHPAALQRPAFRQLEYRLWNGFKEMAPDFLCHKCTGKDIVAGIETRTQ